MMNTELLVKKVAIVDDSPLVVERLQKMLRDLKHVEMVGFARSFSEAISLLDKHRPEVLILDIYLQDHMPSKSGIDLLAEIREQYPEMTIMMLTNQCNPPYKEKCFELGADYFFDKSNEFEKVLEIINTIPQE